MVVPTALSCSVMFLNVCSLRNKVKELKDLVTLLDVDILCLAETWLDSSFSDGEVSIHGYNLHRKDRSAGSGGGVAIYCKSSLATSRRQDLELNNMESIVLDVKSRNGSMTVACFYRPPSSPVNYWQTFEQSLDVLEQHNGNRVIVVGDLNDNLLASHTSHLQKILSRTTLSNHVTRPTRITATSASLLDVVLADSSLVTSCSVVSADISDHFPVLAKVRCVLQRALPPSYYFRRLQSVNWEEFRQDLEKQCLDEFSIPDDVDSMVNEWYTKVMEVLNRHAPLIKKKSHAHQKRPCPWLTDELKTLVQQRNHLHRQLKKHPTDTALQTAHRTARAAARKLERRLKNEYFQNKIQDSGGDNKKMWSIVNTITGRMKSKQVPQASVTDLSSTFGATVTDNTRSTDLHSVNHHGPSNSNDLMEFELCSSESVLKLLQSIDVGKATGHDELPALVLKLCSHQLSPSLCQIFNSSLLQGVVPKSFKKANITPLLKAGDPTNPANYRPISLLPIVSKLLEKIVQQQLISYLDANGLMPDDQFAYRKNHSTEDALTLAINRWLTAKYACKYTAIVFVDMSKAFDSVRHSQLVEELFRLGITGVSLTWFMDYLSGRMQRVHVGTDYSSYVSCTQGVPQGSVLGPLLFTLYIRSLNSCLPSTVCSQQFADDIIIEATGTDPEDIARTLTTAVTNLHLWLKARGLRLNEKKTQVLFLPPRGQSSPTEPVWCNGKALETVQVAKYLGVMIDEHMSWNAHVGMVVAKAKKCVGALWRSRSSLTLKSKKCFYHALIMSKLCYASNAFFPSISCELRNYLEKVTKSAIRAFFGLPHWIPTTPIFVQLQLCKLTSVYASKLLIFVNRCLNGHCSTAFSHYFQASASTSTRGSSERLLRIPFYRGSIGRSTIQWLAAVYWNQLPSVLRTEKNLVAFRKSLKAIDLNSLLNTSR